MQAKEEVVFVIIVVILVMIFMAIMFLVFLTRNKTRKNQLIFENERMRHEYEDALLNTRLEIQEHTMNYISSEIHDNIGQTLSLARIQMNNEDEPESASMADELLGKAIADLRLLSHNLNTNHIRETGFIEAVQSLASQFERTGRYEIDIKNETSGELYIDEEKGLIVFRIIQEVLNNVIKHANATRIAIEIEQQAHEASITITDNGDGFEPESVKSSGIGLKNMRDRIRLVGGHFSLSSTPGEGTQVKIVISDYERSN